MPFGLDQAAARAALDQHLAYLAALRQPGRRPAPGTAYAQSFERGTWAAIAPAPRPRVGRANAYYSTEGPYWVNRQDHDRTSAATWYEAAALGIWGELREVGLLPRHRPGELPVRQLAAGHAILLDPTGSLAQAPALPYLEVQAHLALTEHLLGREWGREPAYLTALYDQGLLGAWLGRLRQALG